MYDPDLTIDKKYPRRLLTTARYISEVWLLEAVNGTVQSILIASATEIGVSKLLPSKIAEPQEAQSFVK